MWNVLGKNESCFKGFQSTHANHRLATNYKLHQQLWDGNAQRLKREVWCSPCAIKWPVSTHCGPAEEVLVQRVEVVSRLALLIIEQQSQNCMFDLMSKGKNTFVLFRSIWAVEWSWRYNLILKSSPSFSLSCNVTSMFCVAWSEPVDKGQHFRKEPFKSLLV